MPIRNRTAAAALLALALNAAAVFGQESEPDTSNAAPQTYPVSGTVVNSATRRPISRALVNAQVDAALTDNEGHFELRLPAGPAAVTVRKPGYDARNSESNHSITVGADMPGLLFALTPDAVITGEVTLPGSDSAAGTRVMAYRRWVVGGREQWVTQRSTTVDSEGKYRIGGLLPGYYLLYTQPERDLDTRPPGRPVEYGYPAVYYPGETDLSAAGILRLTPGQQAEADFTLPRKPFYAVTVKMANPDVGRGGLRLHDATGRTINLPMRRDEQGATVNLPNGSYYFEARTGFSPQGEGPMGGGQMGNYGRVDFQVAGAPIPDLSLKLFPSHAIPVRVRKDLTTAGGSTVQGETTGLGRSSVETTAGLTLWLSPAGVMGEEGGNERMRPVAGSDDGTSFELDGVTPGRYWVSTAGFQGYVSSVTSGGADLSREPLVVGRGSSSTLIEVTLRDDGGGISGQVATTAATPGAAMLGEQRRTSVYAIPLFPSTGQLMQGQVSPTGQFEIPNLAPGAYRVVAFNGAREIEFHSPEKLAKYANQGQVVTVEAGATANVQLDVLPDDEAGE